MGAAPKYEGKLPNGYRNVPRSQRPVNESPLSVLMVQKKLSFYSIEMLTGITTGMLSGYAKNQALPGLVHAMRLQQHLGIPMESWLGTVLGKLMWEETEPNTEERKKKRREWWKNWATENDHYNKMMARRKGEVMAEKPLQSVAINASIFQDFPAPKDK